VKVLNDSKKVLSSLQLPASSLLKGIRVVKSRAVLGMTEGGAQMGSVKREAGCGKGWDGLARKLSYQAF
jgi:hypothetical protein